MSKNTGGPAFPHAFQEMDGQGMPRTQTYFQEGMTLRDYFAIHADISQMSANNQLVAELFLGRPTPPSSVDELQWQAEFIAKARYVLADAMLAERDK